MDLNHLLYRHQVTLMQAEAATCGPSRLAHEGLARLYAAAASRLQIQSGGAPSLVNNDRAAPYSE